MSDIPSWQLEGFGLGPSPLVGVLDTLVEAPHVDSSKAAQEEPPDRGRVVTLSTVTPERVEWVWPGRLPVGKLTVLDGDPALGKSTMSLDWAARISTGTPWPDGTPCRRGDVVLLSAEDGLADTIVPRLHAAGADLSRVHALTEITYLGEDGKTRPRPPSLADLDVIEAECTRVGARLLVIDVLMAYLPSGVDSHRDQDVRGVLHRLAAMAERRNLCILVLRHLNKAGGSNALYRGGGSIGIIGAARSGLLVAPDPDDDGLRVLATTKSNLAASPPALSYRLVSDEEYECGRIAWEGVSEHTASDLLRSPGDPEDRTEVDEAADWLTDWLKDNGGEAPRKDIFKAARSAGFSEATLKRGKDKAGADHRSGGFPRTTRWFLNTVGSTQPEHDRGEPTGPTEPTGPDLRICEGESAQSVQSAQSVSAEPTEQQLALADPLADPRRCTRCRHLKPPGSIEDLCPPCGAQAGAA